MEKLQLNGFKKYSRIFPFEIGDTIMWNGHYMGYYPLKSNGAAMRAMPLGDMWSPTTSTEIPFEIKRVIKKAIKQNVDGDIFVNLKLIEIKHGEKSSLYKWKVVSVDKNDPVLKPDELNDDDKMYLLSLTLNGFKISNPVLVKKRTSNQIILNSNLMFKSFYKKDELNKITTGAFINNPLNPQFYCICSIETMDEMKDQMFEHMQKSIDGLVKKADTNEKLFNQIKINNGY